MRCSDPCQSESCAEHCRPAQLDDTAARAAAAEAHAAAVKELRASNAKLAPRAQLREGEIQKRAGRASLDAWRAALATPAPAARRERR